MKTLMGDCYSTGDNPLNYTGESLAGVDEVGRGTLAGDVVTAAVILDPAHPIRGLADSKKLSEKRRESLFDEIVEKALCWSVARASVDEIDRYNILHATLKAMQRAVENLTVQPEFVAVDGNRLPSWQYPSQAVVKGDDRVACISAAAILAKVTRDREMIVHDKAYPQYGFAAHKGYGTHVHRQALAEVGPCPLHRKSFEPVKSMLCTVSGQL